MIPELLPIEIPEKDITLHLPLSLGVMTEEQYIKFFALFYQFTQKEIEYNDFAIRCVYSLLNLKMSKKGTPEDRENAFAVIAQLAEYIQEFFDISNKKISLKNEYKGNHIKQIKCEDKLHFAPEDYFHDVTFGQYEDALNIFLQYNEMQERSLLQHLAATLYLPEHAEYSAQQAKTDLTKFVNCDTGLLYGVYYTFAAFHNYFSGSQVYYNGKMIDLSILFTDQKGDEKDNYQSPYPSLGLRSTSIEIAKTGILGNLKEVRDTPLWDVALILYDMRKKGLDERAKMELQKKKK